MITFIMTLLGFVSIYQNQKPDINFVVIGDTQWGYSVLRKSIKKINAQKYTEFLAHVGDQETCGGDKMLRHFKRRMSGLRVPYFLAIGNHELVRCGWKYHLYHFNHKKWKNFWAYHLNPRPKSPISTFYYRDFIRRGTTFRFIFIDTSFPNITKTQALWFKSVITNTPKNTAVFIFTHRPFPVPPKIARKRIYYANGAHWHTYHRMNPAAYYRWGKVKSYGGIMWSALMANKSKVLAIFHGHHHAYRKYTIGGVLGYCSGGGGGYLYRNKWYKRTYEVYHYLNVRATRNKLNVSMVRIRK